MFITMLLTACENKKVYDALEKLLSLLDDQVAEKAYEAIYQCRREGRV
jgi:hypothetical protein